MKNVALELIAQWESIQAEFKFPPEPGLGSFSRDQKAKMLSVVSSRRDYWELYVCSVGYLRSAEKKEAVKVSKIIEDFGYGHSTRYTKGFQKYCMEVSTLSMRKLASAAKSFSRAVDMGVLNSTLSDFEYCFIKCGGNAECLEDCMLS